MKEGAVDTKTALVTANSEKRAVFNRVELLFYGVLVFNSVYALSFPVYIALYEQYSKMIVALLALMFIAAGKVRIAANKAALLCGFVAVCLVNILVNHSGLGVLEYIVWPLSIVYFLKKLRLPGAYINRISLIMLVSWALSVAASFQYRNMAFEDGVAGINPNTVAVVISTSCLFIKLYLSKRYRSWLLYVPLYALSLFGLYQTRSRTSLIAFIAILLMELVLKKRIKRSRRLAMGIMVAVVAVGILVPFVYVAMFSSGRFTYNTLFLGKRLFSGRQYIWQNLWEYVRQHRIVYLVGTGYNTDFYSRGSFNLHNSYLMIFAQFGLPILAGYLYYVYRSVSGMYNMQGHISDIQFVCYQIIILVLIIGFSETILVYLPNLIYFAMALGIGQRERTEDIYNDT